MPFTIGGLWFSKDEESKKQKRPLGPVKVFKEKRGRSEVTCIQNFSEDTEKLKGLLKKLKQALACGGSVKSGQIELQGDHVAQVQRLLSSLANPEC